MPKGVLPPAFGLRRVSKETYTADGVISYWNAYVAIAQMHGHGRFVDPRVGVTQYRVLSAWNARAQNETWIPVEIIRSDLRRGDVPAALSDGRLSKRRMYDALSPMCAEIGTTTDASVFTR